MNLLAPKFDLPLENLTWRVFLNDKWQVKKWSGALQLQQQEIVAGGLLDLQSYLQNESSWKQSKTQQAEQMLAPATPRCKTATRKKRAARSSPPMVCPRATRRSTRMRACSSTT